MTEFSTYESGSARADLLAETEKLKRKYPGSNELSEAALLIKKAPLTPENLFQVRSLIRTLAAKKESDLLSFLSDSDALIAKIYRFEGAEKYEKEDCFPPGFEFLRGNNFYFLSFPRLKKKIDPDAKTEKLMDRFIQNGVHDSLLKYEKGRDDLEIFDSYSLIFIHYFRPDQRDLFDTDNINIKRAIDSVNGILIRNDTVSRSHIYQITRESDREYTDLFILKGHDLSDAILANLKRIINT